MATKKKATGGGGNMQVKPKKDTMAKNIGNHMGANTLGKKVPVKKSGGKAK